MVEIELLISSEVEEEVDFRLFKKVFGRFGSVLDEVIETYLSGQSGIVNLILVDDERILEINKEYRGKNKATDVISFAYLEQEEWVNEERVVAVGDIFISLDTAGRQAAEKGHSLRRELEILFVHGLLHLFGFDHNTDAEEAEMEHWAEQVLK